VKQVKKIDMAGEHWSRKEKKSVFSQSSSLSTASVDGFTKLVLYPHHLPNHVDDVLIILDLAVIMILVATSKIRVLSQ